MNEGEGPRRVLGVLVGIITAFLVVMVVEALGHRSYPPPVGLDLKDSVKMQLYLATLPTGAFLFVLCAWLTGAFAGTLLGGLIAKENRRVVFISVSGLLLIGAIANMIVIPHPLWFWCAALIGIPLAGRLGVMVGRIAAPSG